jgi:hypothetical protein
MALIYKDLIASSERNQQVTADVATAMSQGRNCLILTNWTGHLEAIAGALRALGHDPVILKGGMGAKDRAAALARLTPQPGGPCATRRGHRALRGGRVRLPAAGHPVPRRTRRHPLHPQRRRGAPVVPASRG